MRKILCLVLLLFLVGTAAAEPELIPQLAQWTADSPVDVVLSAQVRTHMPFDDARCAQLNGLVKHLSLHLQAGGAVTRAALLVDGQEALWMAQRETDGGPQTQVSWAEGTFACDMNAFLGGTAVQLDTDHQSLTWLEDGTSLLEDMASALESFKKETSTKTSIKSMGVARKKITYTVPKDQTDAFAQAVKDSCPDSMKNVLTALTFSGQQKLILWRSEEGQILRAEYAGQCGKGADSLRKVSLVWRLRRDEDCTRDQITLKTPAVKGNHYNTLSCTRRVELDEDGAVCYELEYDYAVRNDDGKSTWAGDITLKETTQEAGAQLKGSVALSSKPAGAEAEETFILAPDVLLGLEDGALVMSGQVTAQKKREKKLVEDADILLSVGPGAYLLWTETDTAAVPTQQQRENLVKAMGSRLLPYLISLPAEDTLYLSADLPEEAWQRIVEAAQMALAEEELP